MSSTWLKDICPGMLMKTHSQQIFSLSRKNANSISELSNGETNWNKVASRLVRNCLSLGKFVPSGGNFTETINKHHWSPSTSSLFSSLCHWKQPLACRTVNHVFEVDWNTSRCSEASKSSSERRGKGKEESLARKDARRKKGRKEISVKIHLLGAAVADKLLSPED